ncbi:MAG: hypothetical protein PWP03_381 [Candidatus Woesearchaeota archaeon]|nr:hypothetical protein [Candidatus Woesearchaeota archaeon]MDN5327743.1 hypothetical protein [Candidatus Woesearchaeota archaeon]
MPKAQKKSQKKTSKSIASKKSTSKKSTKDKSPSVKVSQKHAETLKDSIDNLTFVMKNIYDIFAKASDEMYEEHDLHFERVAPLVAKLDELIQQNRVILSVIKSLFEEIKDLKKREIDLEKFVESSLLVKDLKELKEVEEDNIQFSSSPKSGDKPETLSKEEIEKLEDQFLNSGTISNNLTKK